MMGTAYDKLSPRHKQFVDQYFIKNMNATAAYKEVYNPRTDGAARASSAQLLANPNIQAAIDEKMAQLAMPANEVLVRLGQQARGNMGDFLMLKDGNIAIDLEKAERLGQLPLIKKITHSTTTYRDKDGGEREERNVNIELYSSQKALEDIAKTYGLFVDKKEVSGKVSWLVVDGEDYEAV